jgi:hypothetical protein
MKKTLISMVMGAGVMYLFDPMHGQERRTQVRGKLADLLPKTRQAVHDKAGAVEVAAQDLTIKVDEKAAEVISSVGPQADGASGGGSEGGEPQAEGQSSEGDTSGDSEKGEGDKSSG